MDRAHINGIDCIFYYEERIPPENAPFGYPYMYHVRHDEDDWTCPISIEQFVFVNFFGTIFTSKPVKLGSDGYTEIEQFELERDYVKLRVKRKLFKKILGL